MKTRYTIVPAPSAGADAAPQEITVEQLDEGVFDVTVNGERVRLDAQELRPREYHLLHGDQGVGVLVDGELPKLTVHGDSGSPVEVDLLSERELARMLAGGPAAGRAADGTVSITAPMPGKVVKCLLEAGDPVEAGQGVIVVEAMKMENELRSTVAGTVRDFKVAEGDNVDAGEVLALIE